MIKLAAVLTACLASLFVVQPWLGAYEYTVWAILIGAITTLAIGIYGGYLAKGMQEAGSAASVGETAVLAIIGGGMAGLFWPATICAFLCWLNLSDGSSHVVGSRTP